MNNCIKSKILLFLLIYCITHVLPIQASHPTQNSSIDIALQKTLTAESHPYTNKTTFLSYKKTLTDLYFLSPYRLLWIKQHNREQQSLHAIIQLFANAKFNGLNAEHYNLKLLRSLKVQLEKQENITSVALVEFDTAISINLLHFLSDLHFGRVNPKKNNFNFETQKTAESFVPLILKAIQKNEIDSLIKQVEPKLSLYRDLKQALADYLLKREHWQPVKHKYTSSLHPGDSAPQIIDIRKQLQTLDSQSQNTSHIYDDPLKHSVIEFQNRHGLTQDGIIGKKTIRALNIPLAERILKIELALERFRWLPKIKPGPIVIVNIPAYQLWAYDTTIKNTSALLTMKVIVGESAERKSPVFSANMHYLEFAPYWNIPHSITVEDILPKLLENDLYLQQQEMELVSGFHNNSLPVPYTEETLQQLKKGTLKLRQRPGYKNALGRIKFIFPNKHAVYLHDTPSQRLFKQSKRDFSHGCIRVEKPTELATFLLKPEADWNNQRIVMAMHLENPKKVRLSRPIPVILFYSTALIIQNKVFFYDDIYQYDANLKHLLLNHNKHQRTANR